MIRIQVTYENKDGVLRYDAIGHATASDPPPDDTNHVGERICSSVSTLGYGLSGFVDRFCTTTHSTMQPGRTYIAARGVPRAVADMLVEVLMPLATTFPQYVSLLKWGDL